MIIISKRKTASNRVKEESTGIRSYIELQKLDGSKGQNSGLTEKQLGNYFSSKREFLGASSTTKLNHSSGLHNLVELNCYYKQFMLMAKVVIV